MAPDRSRISSRPVAADTFEGETGRIQGTITDTSDLPLPNILVTAGGLSTLTAATASFCAGWTHFGFHTTLSPPAWMAVIILTSKAPWWRPGYHAGSDCLVPAQWVSVTFNVDLARRYRSECGRSPDRRYLYAGQYLCRSLRRGKYPASRAPVISRTLKAIIASRSICHLG